mmetsp:Transcript_35077/g.69713  ORF Transcript_35077/g.69713 Transcript_35077/m.69713 type:complete len:285 (+) Transcript_35077:2461-3315(+)
MLTFVKITVLSSMLPGASALSQIHPRSLADTIHARVCLSEAKTESQNQFCRRTAISSCGAFLGLLSQSSAVSAFESKSRGLSASAVADRLNKVPFFSITTSDGDVPYFTKQAKNGASVSVFFSQRSDAEALLPQVLKSTDPEAVVSSVSLDTCWALVSNPDEKLNGGLFAMQANRRQIVNANGNSGKDLKLDVDNKVPLFFDRRLTLGKNPDSPDGVFPLFFKLEDLENVFKKGLAEMPDDATRKATGKAKVEVTTLDSAVDAMRQGSVANSDRILFVSSESFK